MNDQAPPTTAAPVTGTLSEEARRRLRSRRGEPLLVAGWHRVLMIHFEVDPAALQRDVPYQLDLLDGRAFVSTVAFSLSGMRPCLGGRMSAWLFRPIATHNFLNVRTYVRHGGECGIHFLAEWLSSRLAARLGPATFGLPYRYGRITFAHDQCGPVHAQVADAVGGGNLDYYVSLGSSAFQPCQTGSLDEWLMERYTAFNSAGWGRRFFRVWHPTWPQCVADVRLYDCSLLTRNWRCFNHARQIGANYSPGFDTVWMGWPHRV
jgi:hypothetical protein